MKKSAPCIVQRVSVGLKSIAYMYVIPIVFALVFHHFSEKIQPSQSGLPALESIADMPLRPEHGSPYDVFQCIFCHETVCFPASVLHLITVKAVVALHIAIAG